LKKQYTENQVRYFKDISSVAKARINRFLLKPVFPKLITYCVTYRCNCRCVMCEAFKKADAYPYELSGNEINKIFSDRLFSRLEIVRFTGGEPFLKEDIGDIVASIYKLTKARVFYITSNGSMPERVEAFIKKVIPLGLQLHVQISLDDASEYHDIIRGVPGLYKKAYRTLEALQKLRQKWDFEVGINQTISKNNMMKMEEVNRLSKQFNCAHNITLAVKFHEGRIQQNIDFSKPLPFVTIDPMDEQTIEDIYSRIFALKNSNYDLKKRQVSSSLRNLLEGYLNEGGRNRLLYQKEKPKPACTAFFTHFRLLPDGGIASCSLRSSRVVGSLRDKSFSKIWRSDSAQRERKEVKQCGGCWSECDIAPSVFYSGDIIKWALKKLI
jgi:MoaA/NifB/PqqE/SkfB family radical SAM enzyme